MKFETKLKAWRPLQVGHRVVSKTYHKGVTGTVIECLGPKDAPMNGLRRYGVRMDDDSRNIADFLRYELKRIPKNAPPVTKTTFCR